MRAPRSFDPSLVLHDWMKDLTVRYHSANVVLNLLALRLLLVTDQNLSRHILAGQPRTTAYVAGTLKRKAMSYLAPQALTITDDAAWQRLRPFNERVLCAGRPHDFQREFLGHARRAFSGPVATVADVRDRMGQAMLNIVFGERVAPERLSADIRVLFGLVQSPLKRLLWGAIERRRLRVLYGSLRQAWGGLAGQGGQRSDGAARTSLLGIARAAGADGNPEALLQQMPHWMFTFSGSGADLLARGLALIGSRPEVLAGVRREIAGAGPLDAPASIDRLRYLEACLLEAGRLFPPVTRTFHRAPAGDVMMGTRIPPGSEILHVFSLTQRDRAADETANAFHPERWLDTPAKAAAAYPNVFLSGARHCPGRELILFVCKGAAAMLVAESGLSVHCDVLARDPVPFTFPEKLVRFRTS
ncbi:MAG TPA: cytochrome P450 [Gemmatimonadales bacterium]|nr:cytochrome P450 [Gemmatimonadales bacterium]